jgi:Holliday junction DNA helicase RuvB
MDIDPLGLEPIDRLILTTIYERYNGGPVGVETLSHTIGEDKSTIEDVYEPFLVYKGFLQRGPRGREITARGIDHVTATK